jgi:hypothetical protein
MTTKHAKAPSFRLSPRAARHARRLGMSPDHAVRAIANATFNDQDADGRYRFDAEVEGVAVRVVLAPADHFLIDAIQER